MKLLFLEIKLEIKSIAKIRINFGTKKLLGKNLLKICLPAPSFQKAQAVEPLEEFGFL